MRLQAGRCDPELTQALSLILKSKLKSGHTGRLWVEGKSMGYSLPEGSQVEIRYVPIERLRPGDIVAWKDFDRFTVHRLVRVDRHRRETRLVTLGDAALQEDLPFGKSEYLGKIVSVEKPKGLRLPLEKNAAARALDRFTLGLSRAEKLGREMKKRAAHRAVIAQLRFPALKPILRAPYRLALARAVKALSKLECVDDVILYRSLAYEDWIPGLSDIDLWIVLRDSSEANFWIAKEKFDRTKKVFPMLGEAVIVPREILEAWKATGGIRAIEAGHWRSMIRKKAILRTYHPSEKQLAVDVSHEAFRLADIIFQNARNFRLGRQNGKIFLLSVKKHATDLARLDSILR